MKLYTTTMLSVPEAARRLSRNPETIRRWIREGKLRSHRIGTQHFIDEEELGMLTESRMVPLPASWQKTLTGEPMPDWVAILDRSRTGH